MSQIVVNPSIRGFLSLTAHPAGCAANVRRQIELARRRGPGKGLGNVLVIGSSTGYGLSTLVTSLFGYGAKTLSVCFERPGAGNKAGSAGWYNLVEVHRVAKAQGRQVETINGDAFSTPIKQQAVAALKERFGKVDQLIYSIASPRRTDPTTGTTYNSVLKPVDAPYSAKSINLDNGQVRAVTINPASEAEIHATVKVMGGEDWAYWVEALRNADLIAPGFRTVAYSYIGPRATYGIYRTGTIGRAKDHLEATGRALDEKLRDGHGGGAWVSVNKALVTQASSAIPVVPLYISLLYRVMKERGNHEGTIEQVLRLYRSHLAPNRTPMLDDRSRIRLDNRELDDEVQSEVMDLWEQVTSENFTEISDFAGFHREFRNLFGFEVEGIDYREPIEVESPLV
jgi:enoyl-[acyl-carrier protein] reductase/trans-2-enoyl-CoA reductase (NAD+)